MDPPDAGNAQTPHPPPRRPVSTVDFSAARWKWAKAVEKDLGERMVHREHPKSNLLCFSPKSAIAPGAELPTPILNLHVLVAEATSSQLPLFLDAALPRT
jgi:hypothetical protein